MHDRTAMEQELSTLAVAVRKRGSVDLFLRAAAEGFCWAVLSGVGGKGLWDSPPPPLFCWPLPPRDVALVWDAVRSYREGAASLQRELRREARVRELRAL